MRPYPEAHQVLQRALARLKNGKEIVDLPTQIELARYAGLAAVRIKEFTSMEYACAFLREDMRSTKRAKPAAAMATFIEGLQKRLEGNFKVAIFKFETALQELEPEPYTHHQRAAIYTELVQCYLRVKPKQYQKALDMGKAAYANNDVIHTLNVYLKALIAFVLESGQYRNAAEIKQPITELEDLLYRLSVRCLENGQDFHVFRNEEYARAHVYWESKYRNSSYAHQRNALQEIDHSSSEMDYF